MLYYSTTVPRRRAATIKVAIAILGPMIVATGKVIVVLLAELSFNYEGERNKKEKGWLVV